jgi:hypothetical protein
LDSVRRAPRIIAARGRNRNLFAAAQASRPPLAGPRPGKVSCDSVTPDPEDTVWRTALALAAVAADSEGGADREALRGTWQVRSMTDYGVEMPLAEVRQSRPVIDGDKMTAYRGTEKRPAMTITDFPSSVGCSDTDLGPQD